MKSKTKILLSTEQAKEFAAAIFGDIKKWVEEHQAEFEIFRQETAEKKEVA